MKDPKTLTFHSPKIWWELDRIFPSQL